jgi:membrane protease YdiL (CAAX protease family)
MFNRLAKKFRPFTNYIRATRSTPFSLLATLPLLVIYEICALSLNKNQVFRPTDFSSIYLEKIIGYSGVHGPFILGIAFIVAIFFAWLVREKRRTKYKPYFMALVVLESAAYALLLGYAAHFITSNLLMSSADTGRTRMMLVMAFGAGFYEELIFRAFLFYVSAITLIKLNVSRIASYALTAVISSIVFSWFHYLNSESFDWYSAFYRFVFGLIFCLLFKMRGLAVCAWSHTLYNIFLYLPEWQA